MTRLDRVAAGNLGDFTSLGMGLFELRFFFGPGYRVYFGMQGNQWVLLLCGGDKSSQRKDIQIAQQYWKSVLEEDQK
jgi:putative addiction module killer protein